MEAPHPKMNPVQYLRCQNYSHTRTYVHHTPKCVKCGDTHNSNKCLKMLLPQQYVPYMEGLTLLPIKDVLNANFIKKHGTELKPPR